GGAIDNTGDGYWMVDSAGNLHPFGDAPNLGSHATDALNDPIVDIVNDAAGTGYWEVTATGQVYPFGAAVSHGDLSNAPPLQPIVSMAVTAGGAGYLLLA